MQGLVCPQMSPIKLEIKQGGLVFCKGEILVVFGEHETRTFETNTFAQLARISMQIPTITNI